MRSRQTTASTAAMTAIASIAPASSMCPAIALNCGLCRGTLSVTMAEKELEGRLDSPDMSTVDNAAEFKLEQTNRSRVPTRA